MAEYDDPLDAADQLPTGFKRYIDPTEAAARGLQYTGGNVGWQPFVSPEQATAQGLQYTGGTAPDPAAVKFGYFTPPGGGPVTLATPENLARAGGATFGTGANAGAYIDRANANDLASNNPILRIQQQRRQIGQQIGSTYSKTEQHRLGLMMEALNDQERSMRAEADDRRITAHQNAMELHHQLSTDRDTDIDEQGHGLLQTMGRLDAMLRRGRITKDQYDDALIEAGAQFPLATRHPEAARHFEFAITQADKQNAYNERRELTQAAKYAAKYGIEPQFDPETGRPSIEHTKRAALQTDKGRLEAYTRLNNEMTQKYGIGSGVASLFNPIAQHEEKTTKKGTFIKIPYPDPKAEGGVGAYEVPKALFDQMKADFNDRYFALQPSANVAAGVASPNVQPTATPAAPSEVNPRVALAQRALNDPNASEAHKAAARKILGVE